MTAGLPPLVDVAIVDDDPIVAAFLRTTLERAGYTVVACPIGGEAIPCIETHRPQVVIMDVLMPEIDGVQLFQMLRRVLPTLPVIFCTAAPRRLRELLPGRDGQGATLLVKPFEVDALVLLVRSLVDAGMP